MIVIAVIKRNMLGLGVEGWMADFGEYLPVDAVLYSGQRADLMHNLWPKLWAQLNHQAVAEMGDAGNDVVFFSRSGFSGKSGFSGESVLNNSLVSYCVSMV